MQNLSSFLRRLGLLSAAVSLLGTSAAVAQTAFTAGNYVVVRVGDGTAALTSTSTATFLQEYSATGTGALVQTIALPTADAGTTLALTETGTSTSDASLARSADGRYLLLPGYNAAAGAVTAVSGTAASATNRVIGRIAADGTFNTSTRISDAFSATNIRGVASANGATFYAVGGNNGVVYVPLGNTGASTIFNTAAPTNLRTVAIANGNLYVSSGSGAFVGVSQVGSGLPTTAPQTTTLLPGFATPTGTTQALLSPYGFFLTDQSAAVPGPDVLYIADDGSATGSNGANGGIQKWSLVNNTWVLNGLITAATNPGLRGITGGLSGTTVTLVASSSGSLYRVTDNAGYNVAPSTLALPTAFATAGTNMAFRGVAPAPLATALAARPEAAQAQLALYPNPAQDVLTISLAEGTAAGHSAAVRDLLGRTVRTATLPASGQLSLVGLPAGTYLLTVDGSLTRRITHE